MKILGFSLNWTFSVKKPLKCPLIAGFVQQNGLRCPCPLNRGVQWMQVYLKPKPNNHNISTKHFPTLLAQHLWSRIQQIATLLGATCWAHLATLLQHVDCFQIWANNTQHLATFHNTSQKDGQTGTTCCSQQCWQPYVALTCCNRLARALQQRGCPLNMGSTKSRSHCTGLVIVLNTAAHNFFANWTHLNIYDASLCTAARSPQKNSGRDVCDLPLISFEGSGRLYTGYYDAGIKI